MDLQEKYEEARKLVGDMGLSNRTAGDTARSLQLILKRVNEAVEENQRLKDKLKSLK